MGESRLDERLKRFDNISKENNEIYRDISRKFGLSECTMWILYFLRTQYGEPVQSEICSSFYQPKQSVNSALKKLEAEGRIVLTAGKNKRSKRILLTPAGEKLCEETVDYIIAAEQRALDSLEEGDLEQLIKVYDRYTKKLKKSMQSIEAGL